MSSVGGHSVQLAVKRTLNEVLTNDVAKAMNWTGQSKKRSFRDLQLRKVLESK